MAASDSYGLTVSRKGTYMKPSVKYCWIFSGFFVLVFAGTCLADYLRYSPAMNSAPYWAYVAARAIEFLIPAALLGGAALIMQFRHPPKSS